MIRRMERYYLGKENGIVSAPSQMTSSSFFVLLVMSTRLDMDVETNLVESLTGSRILCSYDYAS